VTVVLTGNDLTLGEVVRVARDGEQVAIAPDAIERMRASRALVERALARGDEVYGLTTGLGMRKRYGVDAARMAAYSAGVVAAHRVGTGPAAPPDVVRAMALRMANGFAKATFGVRPELAERLVEALNRGETAEVRMLGSMGVGDLAPNADLAAGLLDETSLAPKEPHGLVIGASFSTALAALALADAIRLADALDGVAALDLEAFVANLTILHPRAIEVRPYPGLRTAVERLRALLDGSALWEPGAARNLQDPLSYRTTPHVHGALRDALEFTDRQIGIELNASQENPLNVLDEDRIVSVGNFELAPLAAALDFLRIALAPVLTSACERTLKLLQAPLSGLPEGLAERPGLAESALSELAISAQALTAEARLLAHPVSYELVSTTGAEGIEDRTTMAPLAGRRLAEMVALGERLAAISLVVAAQAVDLRGSAGRLGTGTARAYRLVRERVPFVAAGDTIPADLEPVADLVREGALGPG
jgi:histidine ammonia-lyase